MELLRKYNINKELFLKFLRFCVIGGISFFINASFTYLLYDIIKISLIFATIISLLLTQLFQFPMSKKWAFQYKEKTKFYQFLYFIGTRIISILIIIIITDLGTKMFDIPWIFAQLCGVIVGMSLNFIVNNWIVFVDKEKFEYSEKHRDKIVYIVLFLTSLVFGMMILDDIPIIITGDNLVWYTEAKNIIAHNGLPYFSWWHTPIYQYLVAFVIIVFNDNLFYLRLIQILIYATCVCLAYAAIKIKQDKKIALVCAVIYMVSYTNLYAAHHIHQEGLVVLFILLMFYCLFRFEKESRSIWLFSGSFFLGMAFFTKETCLVVIGLYIIYVLLWLKPSRKEILISFAIFSIFLIPFMIVQYMQNWKIFVTYLGIGLDGSDSFLSREGIIEIEKLFRIFTVEFFIISFSFLHMVKMVKNFIQNKKIGSEETFGLSIIFYLIIIGISRGSILHLSYLSFELVYLAGLGVFDLINFVKMKNDKYKDYLEKYPIKTLSITLFPIFLLLCTILIPNLILLRNMKQNRVNSYMDISEIVGSEKIYGEFNGVIGYYFEDYYSPYSWYNSYERNDFVSWTTNEVFWLTSMENITQLKIKYFVFEGSVEQSLFLQTIRNNGTIDLVKRIDYTTQLRWWEIPTADYIELYQLIE